MDTRAACLPSFLLTALLVSLTFGTPAIGQVLFDPLAGTEITSGLDKQDFQSVAPDGFGGALLVWQDSRNGNIDVFAQRIDANGVPLWADNGVAVVTDADNQSGFFGGGEGKPQIIGDGNGGAIVVWRDERSGSAAADIYAQRLDASGAPLWQTNGVPIVTADNEQGVPRVIPDGQGGAFITWEDSRPGGNAIDIYAQRINANGLAQWAADGVRICGAQFSQRGPQLVSDGAGGVIIAWLDLRSPLLPPTYDIYAQRVNANGQVLWQVDGAPVSSAPDDQYLSAMVSDNDGGAILVWSDERASDAGNGDIYAQRINASGQVMWPGDVPVAVAAAGQTNAVAASDGSSGLIAAWYDVRSGIATPDVYMQRVDSTGSVRWNSGGVRVADAGLKGLPVITYLGASRALIAWPDYRNDTGSDVYAQIVDTSGTRLAGPDGFAVAIGAESQFRPEVAPVGPAGTVSWIDYRSDSEGDVRIQVAGQQPATQDVVEISGSELIDLASTAALIINLVNPSGTATIVVERYVDPPSETGSISEQNVSRYHWVLRAPAGFTFDATTEIRFQLDGIPDAGIVDPSSVNIYKRDAPFFGAGAGLFDGVTTSYDPLTGELVATGFTSFSQFVFASDANPLPTEGGPTATGFALDYPAPNPAGNRATVSFELGAPGNASLTVFDMMGRVVDRPWDGYQSAGRHEVDLATANLASGVYFVRLRSQGVVLSRPLVVSR